ncbi:MAG: glutamate synthase subunit alpha, partial [Burkholderiales bacterium]
MVNSTYSGLPKAQGLYSPANEHDACGVGFIAHIKGAKSHALIERALQILDNLTHRGATGYDSLLGDGAGILLQIPDGLIRRECAKLAVVLPQAGDYAIGMMFLPQHAPSRAQCEQIIAKFVHSEGQVLLGWRDVPVDNRGLSEAAKHVEPVIRQVLIGRGDSCADTDAFERKLFVIRKQVEHAVRAAKLEGGKQFYVPSLSARTVVY